jgi:hypothetical protein
MIKLVIFSPELRNVYVVHGAGSHMNNINWSTTVITLLLLLLVFTTHLRVLASSFLRFRDHTHWHNTVSRTPLDEWSARRRDLYLTNTQHSQQTNIHAARGIFFFFVLSFTLSVLLCPDRPGFVSCPYCTTHTTQTFMPPAGFETAIPAGERLQTHSLDSSATGIGTVLTLQNLIQIFSFLRPEWLVIYMNEDMHS